MNYSAFIRTGALISALLLTACDASQPTSDQPAAQNPKATESPSATADITDEANVTAATTAPTVAPTLIPTSTETAQQEAPTAAPTVAIASATATPTMTLQERIACLGLGNDFLWSVKPDGSDLRFVPYVIDDDWYPIFPGWSPDGNWLSFFEISQSSGDSRLMIGQPDGSNIRDIGPLHWPDESIPYQWSPDASKIAYVGESDSGSSALYVIDLDTGSETVWLDDDRLLAPPSFAWSPDGAQIAATVVGDGEIIHHVVLINLANNSETWLIGTEGAVEVAWSSTGTLAFSLNDVLTGSSIILIESDGSNKHEIGPYPPISGPSSLSWSPDGANLAFSVEDVGDSTAQPPSGALNLLLFVANINGSVRKIANTFDYTMTPYSWSPDGKHLAVISRQMIPPFDTIFIVKPDGSGRVDLNVPDCYRLAWNLVQMP